ncbi:MAG: UPF0149 family protein [Gammaproteobacteria bacterium]
MRLRPDQASILIARHHSAPSGTEPSHQLYGEVVGFVCAGHLRPDADPDDGVTAFVRAVRDHFGWGARELDFWQATQVPLDRKLAQGFIDFELGLPADEVALGTRIEALSEWLSGFLPAFGWMDPRFPLSRESHEILEDLAEIRCAETPDEPGEDHEIAFVELVEYVRAAVQFLYDERHSPSGRSGAG